MAALVWPTSLPQCLLQDSFQSAYQDATVRTQMDSGPAYARQRFTPGKQIQGVLMITKAQIVTLDSFYLVTTQAGTQPFTWTDPSTDADADMTFSAPPTITPAGGRYWRAALQLYILP